MQTLADELDTTTKIRVNSVNPGKVRTAMRAKAYPGEVAETVPLPEVVLPTYLYLLGSCEPGGHRAAVRGTGARRLNRTAAPNHRARRSAGLWLKSQQRTLS